MADLFVEPRKRDDDGRFAGRRLKDHRPVAVWDYKDAAGKVVLYQAVRFEPKNFRPFVPNSRGGWDMGLPGSVRRVPYRLSELLGAAQSGGDVYVTEGEKDADAIVRAGGTATTCVMGAESWKQSYGPFISRAWPRSSSSLTGTSPGISSLGPSLPI
jgi:hypothetical protein